jgi:ribulose-5-phosphate 4-epimerase/fuculose-1-phosphate aldolase
MMNDYVDERMLVANACRVLAVRGLVDDILGHVSLRAGSIAGIDNDRKEDYLLDDEFSPALGNMTRAQFAALPEWRRIALKKAAGIF